MKTSRLICFFAITFLLLFGSTTARSLPGDEHWDTHFARPGVANNVFALAAQNGKLYVAGFFNQPIGVTNNEVAVWDGSNWSALPPLHGGLIAVFDLLFFNGDLYVAGTFTGAGNVTARGLARWDGSAWDDVGAFQGLAHSMTVYMAT